MSAALTSGRRRVVIAGARQDQAGQQADLSVRVVHSVSVQVEVSGVRHVVRSHIVIREHGVRGMPDAQRAVVHDEIGPMCHPTTPFTLGCAPIWRRDRDPLRIRGPDVMRANCLAVADGRRDDKLFFHSVLNAEQA
ncbi:hypothetical protein [Nocardioides sp. 1609]|uniref:hypothetical protein n=1 Tax=Nocardioides sp. 1609 TaxID=2508327 RepID=UPI00106F95CC|nr:hypothetical protein [Nocardioides sp. 1609]